MSTNTTRTVGILAIIATAAVSIYFVATATDEQLEEAFAKAFEEGTATLKQFANDL